VNINCFFTQENYGKDKFQVGDLYIPKHKPKAIICLLHGGFWKMPYDKSQLNAVSEKLVNINYSIWNIEYRRIGYIKNGYPQIYDDIVESINYNVELQKKYKQLTNKPIYIVGHSAGGYLSLWLKNSNRLFFNPRAFIGLAPVINLIKSFESEDRRQFILDFIGNSPREKRKLYDELSLKFTGKQVIFHGSDDEVLPINEVFELEKLIKQVKSNEFILIENGKHMDFCDSESLSINTLIEWLENDIIKIL
jgi:acetyl esterase/lipase